MHFNTENTLKNNRNYNPKNQLSPSIPDKLEKQRHD